MNIAESKCSELVSKQELCGAKAGFAHEAMKGYGIGAGGGRDKQLLLHSMFSGRGLLCVLAAKPRVLKSDDPKEGCFEDKATYVPALEFAAQQILCSPRPTRRRMPASRSCWRLSSSTAG